MKRKSQREYNQEIIDFIDHNKNQPIWESNKEKMEYIMQEIQSIRENGAESYIDKIRYDMLLKIV